MDSERRKAGWKVRGRCSQASKVPLSQLDGWGGPSDDAPVAPAKQIVFLVLFLYAATKKRVGGLAERTSLARNK